VFFEGAEKKVEILLKDRSESLLDKPRAFWEMIVKASRAEIIGELRSAKVIAFLLSESSLFVFENRITMITCGETTLALAAEAFIKEIGEQRVDCVIYQRKNEFRSYLQKSSFADDVTNLKKLIPGEAFCFGRFHEHHNLLFSSETSFKADKDDCTVELLMYDIRPDLLEELLDPKTCVNKTRNLLGLEKVLKGFQIDDFSFDPFGYSLNALLDDTYATIHITPQLDTSYISFETNCESYQAQEMIQHFLSVLSPGSFDLVVFNGPTQLKFESDYINRTHSRQLIPSGFQVDFFHYFHHRTTSGPAMVYKE